MILPSRGHWWLRRLSALRYSNSWASLDSASAFPPSGRTPRPLPSESEDALCLLWMSCNPSSSHHLMVFGNQNLMLFFTTKIKVFLGNSGLFKQNQKVRDNVIYCKAMIPEANFLWQFLRTQHTPLIRTKLVEWTVFNANSMSCVSKHYLPWPTRPSSSVDSSIII